MYSTAALVYATRRAVGVRILQPPAELRTEMIRDTLVRTSGGRPPLTRGEDASSLLPSLAPQ